MDLKEIDVLGDDVSGHWYYRSKIEAVKKMIDGLDIFSILDIGAGSGFFSRALLAESSAQKSWCVDVGYDVDSDWVDADKTIHFRRYVGAVEADLVLVMDVLEHVEDDVGLLKEYIGKVPCGTGFLISVPAFQFLWSEHDVFLGHRRRYTLSQICSVAERAGLMVESSAYYFGAILPAVAAMRVLGRIFRRSSRPIKSQLRRHSKVVNGLLKMACHAELGIMRLNHFAGLTAFCMARTR